MPRNKVNLGIRGTIADRERLKELALLNGTTIQELVQSAIRKYLSDATASHPGTVLDLPPLTDENREWLLLAANVLACNTDTDLDDMVKRSVYLAARWVIQHGTTPGASSRSNACS